MSIKINFNETVTGENGAVFFEEQWQIDLVLILKLHGAIQN